MRRELRLLCAAILGCVLASPAAGERIALVGGTVVNPRNSLVLPDSLVIIDGNTITSVARRSEVDPPAAARHIDCRGKWIIPGLWDMHVHLAGVTAEPKWSKGTLLPLLIANGITGVRDMGGDLEALLAWRGEIEAGKLVGPRIIAAGPMVGDGAPGARDAVAVANPEQAREAVREIKTRGGDCVKILSKLSRESYFALMEEAKKQKLDVVGHIPNPITAVEASNTGQKSIEHVMVSNLAFDCSTRSGELRERRLRALADKNSAAAAIVRDEANATFNAKQAETLWQTFVRNGTWVVPTLIGLHSAAHQLDAAVKTDDPRLAFLPAALRRKWTLEEIGKETTPELTTWYSAQFDNDMKLVRAMHAAGVRILAGSDSLAEFNFPGGSLHEELKFLVTAGLTPMQALRAATAAPAQFLGRDGARGAGAVEPKRLADLVLLDADPLKDIGNTQKIHAVILNGRLFDRAQLDELLEQARASVSGD